MQDNENTCIQKDRLQAWFGTARSNECEYAGLG